MILDILVLLIVYVVLIPPVGYRLRKEGLALLGRRHGEAGQIQRGV